MFCFGSLRWLRPSSDFRERSALLCEVLLLWDPHRNELPASFKHVLPFYFWKRWGLYLTSLRTMKEKASLRHVGALLPPKQGSGKRGCAAGSSSSWKPSVPEGSGPTAAAGSNSALQAAGSAECRKQGSGFLPHHPKPTPLGEIIWKKLGECVGLLGPP